MNKKIISLLNQKFGNSVQEIDDKYNLLTFQVDSQVVYEVIKYLKENEELQFEFLTDLCGIHFPDQNLLGVVYHLHNMVENFRIRIKTFVPVDNPVVKTVSDLFSAADWMERETYDFYGITFEGHKNLIRILNVEYLDYFPLRKEYPLEDQTRTDKEDKFFGR